MNKLYKIVSMVAIMVIIIVASIFVQVQAYEYTNKGVIEYVTDAHEVNGVTLQLTQNNALALKGYFMDHPVSDEKAREIIDNLELAREELEKAGVKTTTEVRQKPDLLTKVLNYIDIACKAADLDFLVDTDKKPDSPFRISIKDKQGSNIISGDNYSDIFGSNNLNAPENPDDPNKPVDPDDNNNTVNTNTITNNITNNNTIVNNNTTVNNNKNDNNSNNNNNKTNTVSKNSTAKKLVYTGNDYSLVIRIIIAIVAIAIIGFVVKKHAK